MSNFENLFFIIWESNVENEFLGGANFKKYFWTMSFFERALVKMYFLRKVFWKYILIKILKKHRNLQKVFLKQFKKEKEKSHLEKN